MPGSASHHIRRARPSEADALTRLARAAKASWGYPAEWLDAWRAELTLTAESIQRNPVFVAEQDGALAGVAALERTADGTALEHLWVSPEHQRRGLGEALVRHALACAAAAGDAAVRVTSDPQALGFYERQGARVVTHVPAPMPGAPGRTLPVLELPTRPRP